MRLYAFASPISNVITLKLFLDLGIWSLADFFSSYLLTICFSDALGQDEDVNTYINGSTWSIDRFHSRDQFLDYRCYAAILVYLNCKQTSSVLRVEHGFVSDRWLWQQKWTR